jgi:hypothetical protein
VSGCPSVSGGILEYLLGCELLVCLGVEVCARGGLSHSPYGCGVCVTIYFVADDFATVTANLIDGRADESFAEFLEEAHIFVNIYNFILFSTDPKKVYKILIPLGKKVYKKFIPLGEKVYKKYTPLWKRYIKF